MKVFIKWSGTRSRQTASLLRTWLPKVINEIRPSMSSQDIAAGADWSQSILDSISDADFAIVCLTPENRLNPNLLFETGLLGSRLDESSKPRLVPFLVGFESKMDIEAPYSRYQVVTPTFQDVLRMMESLVVDANLAIDARDLRSRVSLFWPQFAQGLASIENENVEAKRTDREILEEILNTMRMLNSSFSTLHGSRSTKTVEESDENEIPYSSILELERIVGMYQFEVDEFQAHDGLLVNLSVLDAEPDGRVDVRIRLNLLTQRLREGFGSQLLPSLKKRQA